MTRLQFLYQAVAQGLLSNFVYKNTVRIGLLDTYLLVYIIQLTHIIYLISILGYIELFQVSYMSMQILGTFDLR